MSSRPAATHRATVPRSLARRPKRALRPTVDRQIDDRLPTPLPVTAAEIDLLDRTLGAAIDIILKQ
jgi:hypothetical protein